MKRNELAEVIRRERLRLGMTQLELAVRAHCSLSTVSLAERAGYVSRKTARRIADVLKAPLQGVTR